MKARSQPVVKHARPDYDKWTRRELIEVLLVGFQYYKVPNDLAPFASIYHTAARALGQAQREHGVLSDEYGAVDDYARKVLSAIARAAAEATKGIAIGKIIQYVKTSCAQGAGIAHQAFKARALSSGCASVRLDAPLGNSDERASKYVNAMYDEADIQRVRRPEIYNTKGKPRK